MRRRLAVALAVCLVGTTAALSLGCGGGDPKPAILAELGKAGVSDVTLEVQPDGTYRFRGQRDGLACFGAVKVVGSGGSAVVEADVRCPRLDDAPAADAAAKRDPYPELTRACEGGDAKGCVELGDKLSFGSVADRDLERARAMHGKACDAGELTGCEKLGWLHLKALGGAQDVAGAEALFQKACDGGHMDGCARVARVWFVAGTYGKARELFEKACTGGSALACDGLASMMKRGMGGKKDVERAKTLFEDACGNELWSACANLGVMYLKGQAGPKDAFRAKEYLQSACDKGEIIACEHIKLMDKGDEVPDIAF